MNNLIKEKILKVASPRLVKLARIVRDYLGELFDPFPYRAYMRRKKCVFIHIPKCAGTSVRRALGASGSNRDHIEAKVYLKANPSRFNKYYKFAFTRNPWDRLVSVYEYWRSGGNQTTDFYYKSLIDGFDGFDDFVLRFLNHDRIHENLLLKPQYLFIYDHKGQLMVDYVGKFEDIADDFSVVRKVLRIGASLEVVNKTSRASYEGYYENPAVREKVEMLYKRDIDILGYGFGDEK